MRMLSPFSSSASLSAASAASSSSSPSSWLAVCCLLCLVNYAHIFADAFDDKMLDDRMADDRHLPPHRHRLLSSGEPHRHHDAISLELRVVIPDDESPEVVLTSDDTLEVEGRFVGRRPREHRPKDEDVLHTLDDSSFKWNRKQEKEESKLRMPKSRREFDTLGGGELPWIGD